MSMEVTNATFQKEVLEAEQTVLADFWAPWCGPCRMQAPILEEFAAAHGEVKTVKINVDDNPELAERYKVMSIPTLMVFKNGVSTKTVVGLHSKAQLEELAK